MLTWAVPAGFLRGALRRLAASSGAAAATGAGATGEEAPSSPSLVGLGTRPRPPRLPRLRLGCAALPSPLAWAGAAAVASGCSMSAMWEGDRRSALD
jgi:hypothetical protein